MKIIPVTQAQARRIAVRAQALDGSATGILEVVHRLGFLQMDPISVVARPEHLVLYSRLGQIDVAELDRLIWEEHKLFEWDAFLWPMEDLPLVRARMRLHRATANAWTRGFLRANARLRQHVRRELERNGPVLSRHLTANTEPADSRHSWWGTGQLRLMLDLLQGRGEIAVAGRHGNQRLWDLAERVYPDTDTIPWPQARPLIEEKKRRALGVWLERGALRACADIPDDPVPPRLTFLSPFDRLIHDRRRAEALLEFEYRLEMYVPEAKRKFGYYVLPILRGDRIIGRIDVARDKPSNTLRVNKIWWENGTKPVPLERALRRLEAFVCSER
ncbi:MAG: winged helix DNA-binding domain-containing protein [Actinomycetota bacterium]|nr:winged helix DNA-binding domain-containing protein [Actinomycetota bacterium]